MDNPKYSVRDKVAIISGSSRGIGAETAIRLAKEGCHVVILGKTDAPHDTLKGTIHETAELAKLYGVEALPIACDIRDDEQISNVIDKVAGKFGQLDYLINNASAVYLHDTLKVTPKQYDLMMDVNVRGTYMLSKACIPLMKHSKNPHILTYSPPLVMDAQFFFSHGAYTMSKFGMSMTTLTMSHEFFHDNIAVNSLWPRTIIYTAAMERLGQGKIAKEYMRKPVIMADAAYAILKKPTQICSGTFMIDDLVLQAEGVTNFDQYSYMKGHTLLQDLFVPHDTPPPPQGVMVQNINFANFGTEEPH